MSLTGIIVDVSGSMKDNIGSGTDEESGPWAQSIFKVIDDLIERDVSSDNRVFAIGVGANCTKRQIFDVIGTVQRIGYMKMPDYGKNMPATTDHIKEVLDLLEKNGSRNIRKWANNVNLIQDTVSDHMAALILAKLESDTQFLSKFVDEFLPPTCRDKYQSYSRKSVRPVPIVAGSQSLHVPDIPDFFVPKALTYFHMGIKGDLEDFNAKVSSFFRSARREDIEQVVEEVKCYFLKDVGTYSIFSVENASRIIRGCVDEEELSSKRKQELLENVEPFIYGYTPLYESFEKAIELFEGNPSRNKLLFVLSDGKPSDGSNEDWDRIKDITDKLTKAGVKIVSCFITSSKDIDPKRLYDEISPDWKPGAKFLFSLSSEVPTQHLPRAILVKRGWTIDITNNETKLFIQVNHPDNLRYIKFNRHFPNLLECTQNNSMKLRRAM